MADFWFAEIDFFFALNPGLERDCSNIQPNTEYCTVGCESSLAAANAGMCVSSEDCAPGTCYEGFCPGDAVWSTGGTCDTGHGNRQCAGKWGDCCNQDGWCGTGPDFCGKDVCQMGNCTAPIVPVLSSSVPVSFPPVTESFAQSTTATSLSLSSTAGSNAQGISDHFKGLRSYSCDFNLCPAGVFVCTSPAAEPAAIPELTDRHGCPGDNVAGGKDHAYYVDLCELTCSHGYCPAGTCQYC
ncbi:glutathione S-transferase [Colletotrichum tofieldiae]|nr:glutathione S-transferase [Colletotrichum tofieldiae]GKT80200.1 glutathione S-transferase [Colletotrichum tofieldiae]